jgi:glycosyltransferase involved in cell wall biosynthesis
VPSRRQLLVDVSTIVSGDAGTGIQRVVRALLGKLLEFAGPDLDVQPIFATRDYGYCRAKLNANGTVTSADEVNGVLQPVSIRTGDVFLGLDLAAHLIPHLELDLQRWRHAGVSLNFLVYDLLPVMRPEWFPPTTSPKFERWLKVLGRQADQCICISDVVAKDLFKALENRGFSSFPKISTIPLGFDLSSSYPSRGFPADVSFLRGWLQRHEAILTVGTVEPRKGHNQLIDAMSHHWNETPDSKTALLVVGRPGWKTEKLQARLRGHPENGKRLLWLCDASDELLSELYGHVVGLVAPSHAEGFGLPLLEALGHSIPVLARDIPIFHEIGGNLFDYFEDDAAAPLTERMQTWLRNRRAPSAEAIATLPRWADSATALMQALKMVRA